VTRIHCFDVYNISLGANRVWRGRSTASILWSIVSLLVPRYLLYDNTCLPSPLIVGNCLSAIPISRIFSRVKGRAYRSISLFISPHAHSRRNILRIPVFNLRFLITVRCKTLCYNDTSASPSARSYFSSGFCGSENYGNIHASRRVLPFQKQLYA